MPDYAGISMKIHTPFALQGLPEIAPTDEISHRSPATQFVDESRCCVSVFVPVMPQAQFWISYNVEEPPTEPEGIFYVFKLLVNGQPLVTWCCGEKEGWRGKTMFSLYDAEQDDAAGGAGMQKMCFHFSKPDEDGVGEQAPEFTGEQERCIEVKICRANLRIRVPRDLPKFKGLPDLPGFELRTGGITKRGNPRTFYKFGLLDPFDSPRATFRFYCRTVDEFEALNLKTEQLDIKQPEPLCQASPVSIRSEASDKHWMPPSRIPIIKLERTPSISDSYFSYPNRAPGKKKKKKKRVSTNGDGSPQKIHCEDSPQPSPERQRPLGPRRIISRGTTGPWVPPMPNAPVLPPPVPKHADIWQFGPVTETTTEDIELVHVEMDQEPVGNPKRLSIPPSMVLRPIIAHGPLDASPQKTDVGPEAVSHKDKALPPSPRRRARTETGGLMKCVLANSIARRRNLTSPETRRGSDAQV
ncbi:hypothetical protein E2P81_ATG02319 [Venturia nashicola]|uniref:Uncharacterized protein n=1 Tax=Venturia nashicola TaxID=86259 RepID=A0A4Z1PFB0_9PEZI|nr:hypothetical protein E6O75_ATG02376 [Venturia nashicola]TLD36537.1 hypothetical protein E2P81_ATG02319 [Venturia nashicola]